MQPDQVRLSFLGYALAAMALLVAGLPSSAQAQSPEADCAALARLDLEALPDAPTRVISARLVTVGPEGLVQPPATMTHRIDRFAIKQYCEVKGYTGRQNQFELRLPLAADWNQKFFFLACAGFCGTVGGDGCNGGLAFGYASVTSNGGHVSAPGFDGLWAANDRQSQIEFAWRGNHAVTVAAKAITTKYYGRAIARSYMAGCSKGGQATLAAGQRFPQDFDGLIVVAPVYDYVGKSIIHGSWVAQANQDAGGGYIIDEAAAKLAHASIMDACDGLDGIKDGLVSDPQACDWKPATLLCRGDRPNAACLSARQVEALERLYAKPVDSRGKTVFPSGNVIGSETEWPRWVYGRPFSANYQVAQQFLRYLAFVDKPAPISDDPIKFSFDKDPAALVEARAIYDTTGVDLRAFKARGGKIILWHGLADAGIPATSSVDYYVRVLQFMGGRNNTHDFLRLFLLPGVHHCGGGYGPDQVDALGALDQWVEAGKAPDVLVTTQSGSRVRTRPVFPYPMVPVFSGSGSPDEATNYRAVDSSANGGLPTPSGVY
jgi:feruloyl esterase